MLSGKGKAGLLDRPGFWRWAVAPAAAGYLALLERKGRLRREHVLILGSLVGLCPARSTQRAAKSFFPFYLFAVIYDAMRFVTPLVRNKFPIHVREIYDLEKKLFGIEVPGRSLVTPPEFFDDHRHLALDLLSAFGYTFYLLQSILLALYWQRRRRPVLGRFAWAFLVLNLLGFATYLLYPVAPPWYVRRYGLGPPRLDAPGDPARLAAVDSMLKIGFFRAFYRRSANVFAALPSLHVAYPLLAWLYARRELPRLHWAFLSFWLLVCFSAVYLRHHYVIDVLLGSAYSLVTYLLLERPWSKKRSR